VVLKGIVGSALAAAFMFALRRWVHLPLDLSGLGAGVGAVGQLAATSLPAVATLLAVLFDLDNTGDEAADSRASAGGHQQVRISERAGQEDLESQIPEEEELVDRAPRRRHR
jgi:hypothetical protein